jgi:serine/threonine-protein kinase HipA
VALKVQRPNIPKGLELDFHLIRVGAGFADRFVDSLNTSIVDLVDEFAARVFQELNYVQEGMNAERFDRLYTAEGWQRRAMVSALTLFGLDEMMARYASYADLTEIVRHRFTRPKGTLRELFGRLAFNILCGNTDDHARNHAAFWDGRHLTLTPAYDICPQNRTGNEATQAMLVTGEDRMSRLATCLAAAPNFLLDARTAEDLIAGQIEKMQATWPEVAEEAGLTEIDRALLAGRIFLNPFVFEGAPARLSGAMTP